MKNTKRKTNSFIEENNLCSVEEAKKLIRNEIERNSNFTNQEKQRHDYKLHNIREKSGLDDIENICENNYDIKQKIVDNRKEFLDQFISIINIITCRDRERVCIRDEFTIRDGSIYVYHSSNHKRLHRIIKNDKNIRAIIEETKKQDDKEALRKSFRKLRSYDDNIKRRRYYSDISIYEGEKAIVANKRGSKKFKVCGLDEFDEDTAIEKVQESGISNRYKINSNREKDIRILCKHRDDIYKCTIKAQEKLINKKEKEKEMFKSILSNHKTAMTLHSLAD
jgi:hypothetical protein